MSKKPRKSGPRGASKGASAKSRKAATKRPSPPSDHDVADRIARALEAIAAGLPASSPKTSNADVLASADAFIWHPNGRLAPVPRVNRVDLGLLRGIDRMRSEERRVGKECRS